MQLVATLIVAALIVGSKGNKMAEILDLSKEVDEEYFNWEDLGEDAGTYTKYSAKDGFIIGKVIEGYNFIWERRSYLEEPKEVKVYKRNKKPFLVSICVSKNGKELNLYYMSTISTWSEIDEEEFNNAKSKQENGPEGDKAKFMVPLGTVSALVTLITGALCHFYVLA